MTIKAIETRYDGYRFRSRLEARWAVTFNAMGLDWDYEPEGFHTAKGEMYLPDFHIKDFDTWIEIKPSQGKMVECYGGGWQKSIEWTEWEPKWAGFPHRLVVINGDPGEYEGTLMQTEGCDEAERKECDECEGDECQLGIGPIDHPYLFCRCQHCGSWGIQYDGRAGRNEHSEECINARHYDDKDYGTDDPLLLDALRKGRSARFEHREKG